jgi:hypothetical protein
MNLLSESGDSLSDSVNNSLLNSNQRSLWLLRSWSLNVSDDVSDSLDLSGDLGDGFL